MSLPYNSHIWGIVLDTFILLAQTRSLCYHADEVLLFAHTGIPLSVAWVSHKAILQARRCNAANLKMNRSSAAGAADCLPDNLSDADSLATRFDYRLILLGLVVPDLIDKPLGVWLLRDALSNGRVFAHTLLFGVLLLAVGVYVYIRRRNLSLLCLSFGNIAYLGLDEMWLNSGTLFWAAIWLELREGRRQPLAR